MTTGPIVATKLFVPTPRPSTVERARLNARLERGMQSKLTLISAPAGFGKTTIVATWLASSSTKRAVAWLSLDQADNDPAAFWTHVVAALDKATGGGAAALGPILQPRQHPMDAVLGSIVNELSALALEIDLVLDDYHLVDHIEVQSGMQFLLDHLPPNVHLFIATRADPSLSIARLRARGELVEIRSADLRFTAEEATTYLNQVMGLGLTTSNIAALEDRTEGWAAALQLAALSMQGRTDLNAFIDGFTGHDRYIFDYLVEEVLERQSVEVRRFLLQTCFLDRLNGSLCDAVTGTSGSKAMLEILYRSNLFLVPLDDRREWFRYHHLFADVLLTQLDGEARRQLPVFQLRACDWYEDAGERPEAIQHALAAESFERAAELIELAIPQMRRDRNHLPLRRWILALPDKMVRARPVIGVAIVGVLLSGGEFEGVPERLRDAEHALEALGTPGSGAVAVDEEQLRGVPAQIELFRTALAQIGGDLSGTIAHAQRAFDLSPPDDHFGRAGAAGFLGIAFWTNGDLDEARRWWAQSASGLQRTGHLADVLGVTRALADILATEGRLREAVRACESALQLEGAGILRGSADLHVRLSEFSRECDDMPSAREHLAKSQELGEPGALPQHAQRMRVAMARLRQDDGDLDGAIELLDEAERCYASDFFPDAQPISAIRARVRIVQGRVDEARRWTKEQGLAATDELSYLREFEHVTLARLLLVQSASTHAITLLDRLLAAAEMGGRTRTVIEIEILRALANRQSDTALASLERALRLAEPEGYVRLFVDEGPPMEALLKVAVKRRIVPAYARRLLGLFSQRAQVPQAHPDLIEPLSEREVDVLKLLRTDLGGPEIAAQLAVSLNTVRTHTKAIYEKLGVNNRRAAVSRALELNLLRSDH